MKTDDSNKKERDSYIYAALAGFLNEIGLSESGAGYIYIIEAVAAVAKSFDLRMTAKEIYSAVAQKIGKSVGTVILNIRNSLDKLWIDGNQDLLNGLFPDYRGASPVRPSNKRFLLSLADYLIREKIRVIDADGFAKALSGYMLLTLKGMRFSDEILIEILKRIEGNAKIFNCEEAEKTYEMFIFELTPFMIDGMAVARKNKNISVSDLRYSRAKIGYEIVKALNSKNIFCLKDFQKYNIDNLWNVRWLDEKYIIEFDDALMRTIIKGAS